MKIYNIYKFKMIADNYQKLRKQIIETITQQTYFQDTIHLQNSSSMLTISNSRSRYQLRHGGQFKNFLQARDQVLQHPFCFTYNLQDNLVIKTDEPLLESQLFGEIKRNIKAFLVEAISNVVSAGFKFLLQKDLQDLQAAEFTSKNIMLNCQSIYRQTIQALKNNPALSEKINLEELKFELVLYFDIVLGDILINLADSYPQAPISGGTPRMRQAINEINRTQNEQNDFIFTCGIKISDYLQPSQDEFKPHLKTPRADADYTEFIMKVINQAISVTQDHAQDFRQRTVCQKYVDFNQHLFWISQQKPYQEAICIIDQNEQKEESKDKARIIANKFDNILTNDEEQEIQDGGLFSQELQSLWAKAEDGIPEMKVKKQFALGQKIPAAVKPFNRQEIAGKQFTSKHSSIIRILTKWAGYLESIFKNAQKMVRQRRYPFTNIHNQLVNLEQNQKGTQKLVYQLHEEYQQVKKKFSELMTKSYEMMGKFLSEVPHEDFISSVNRYAQTRTISSKINAVLTSLMLSYTNILIHHLLKAGQYIWTNNWQWHNINLVVFRVSDLLRSKLQCSQSGFICLLKTMYLLENSDSMWGKFKLVRIKNKLDDPANNIIVNYLFMGQVQCQLQLSIQQVKGKQKSYYTFSHMVYELTRGKFGIIAECAIMISQLDPMITACKGTYYEEKKLNLNLQRPKKKEIIVKKIKEETEQGLGEEEDELVSQQVQQVEKVEVGFFECELCSRLITNQHTQRLFPQDSQKFCYQCIISRKNPQTFLNNQLKELFWLMQPQAISNYQSLKGLQDQKFMIQFTAAGAIKLRVLTFIQKEMKTYSIDINPKLFEDMELTIDFSTLNYIDISKQIKEGVSNPKAAITLAYIFDDAESIPEDILDLIKIRKEELGKVKELLEEFNQFRLEKNIIKTIKYKVQIIKVKGDQGRALDKVCRVLVLREDQKDQKLKLKYTKIRHLDLSNIKQITAPGSGLTEIPKWITKECYSLTKLELQGNNILRICKQDLSPSLSHLNLQNNGLQQIDISNVNGLTTLYLNLNKLINFDMADNNSLATLNLFNNKLNSFDIGENSSLIELGLFMNCLTTLELRNNESLKQLTIFNNPGLLEIFYLPPSLQVLAADRQVAINYDFQSLVNLKVFYVCNGKTEMQEITNLSQNVKFQNR